METKNLCCGIDFSPATLDVCDKNYSGILENISRYERLRANCKASKQALVALCNTT